MLVSQKPHMCLVLTQPSLSCMDRGVEYHTEGLGTVVQYYSQAIFQYSEEMVSIL